MFVTSRSETCKVCLKRSVESVRNELLSIPWCIWCILITVANDTDDTSDKQFSAQVLVRVLAWRLE